jgi:hypothetical protein
VPPSRSIPGLRPTHGISIDADKIQDAAYQVTQSGNPVKGPFQTKDAEGNVRMAYNYEGRLDGITVRTIVFADNGEIRTAFRPTVVRRTPAAAR